MPIDEEGFDLSADEVIGAGCAKAGQTRSVIAVDEPEHGLVVLDGGDDAFGSGQPSTQKRNDFDQDALTVVVRQWSVFRTAKCQWAPIALFDVAGRSVNDFERRLVAGFVIVAPGTHAVMA